LKKIVHLSDLHIGYWGCNRKLSMIRSKIFEFVNDPADTVIILTGDLVDIAFNPISFFRVKSFIRSLKEKGFTVLIAPGNHDYGTGGWGLRFFAPLFRWIYFNDPGGSFPRLKIIDDVAFIALDSMAAAWKGCTAFFAQGKLGEKQLDRLREMINLPEVRECSKRVLYLHHHPFDSRPLLQLKDSDELQKVVKGKVDAMLYGHFHDQENGHFDNGHHGFWDIPRCYNAASSTAKGGKQGRVMMIDLEKEREADRWLNMEWDIFAGVVHLRPAPQRSERFEPDDLAYLTDRL